MEYKEREELFNIIMKSMRNLLYEHLNLDKHMKLKPFIDNKGYVPLLSFIMLN